MTPSVKPHRQSMAECIPHIIRPPTTLATYTTSAASSTASNALGCSARTAYSARTSAIEAVLVLCVDGKPYSAAWLPTLSRTTGGEAGLGTQYRSLTQDVMIVPRPTAKHIRRHATAVPNQQSSGRPSMKKVCVPVSEATTR